MLLKNIRSQLKRIIKESSLSKNHINQKVAIVTGTTHRYMLVRGVQSKTLKQQFQGLEAHFKIYKLKRSFKVNKRKIVISVLFGILFAIGLLIKT